MKLHIGQAVTVNPDVWQYETSYRIPLGDEDVQVAYSRIGHTPHSSWIARLISHAGWSLIALHNGWVFCTTSKRRVVCVPSGCLHLKGRDGATVEIVTDAPFLGQLELLQIQERLALPSPKKKSRKLRQTAPDTAVQQELLRGAS